jgi:hypothetical protein
MQVKVGDLRECSEKDRVHLPGQVCDFRRLCLARPFLFRRNGSMWPFCCLVLDEKMCAKSQHLKFGLARAHAY